MLETFHINDDVYIMRQSTRTHRNILYLIPGTEQQEDKKQRSVSARGCSCSISRATNKCMYCMVASELGRHACNLFRFTIIILQVDTHTALGTKLSCETTVDVIGIGMMIIMWCEFTPMYAVRFYLCLKGQEWTRGFLDVCVCVCVYKQQ